MIKAILFDFDGTLINTNDVIMVSFQHTFMHYLGHEVPESKITSFFGETLWVTMEREFPGVDPEEAMEVYRNYQKAHPDLVKVFPGVREMLEELKAAGLRLAIVTSRTTGSTMAYLEQFGLGEYFEAIISCDDTNIHKPEPEPALLALERLGIAAEEALFVGDGPFDIGCANNAGVPSVLVDWRITEDFDEYTPTYRVKTPEELVTLAESLQ